MNPALRLIELIEDWRFLIRRDGLISTMPLVTREILQLPFRHLRFWIFARSLDETLPVLQTKKPFEIRPFDRADLKFVRVINRPSEARLCELRLSLRHYGIITMNHNNAAGYGWGCGEVNPLVERVPVRLEQGDFLCNDAFTTPAYRGQGVHTALTLARMHLFQELGFRRALCYIEKSNNPSISVWQRKLNGTIIGQIDFKRIGPYYQVKFSDY